MSFSRIQACTAGLLVASGWVLAGCAEAEPASPQVAAGRGHFLKHCVSCHGLSGAGVEGAFPALRGSTVVEGDPKVLVRVLLETPRTVLGNRGYPPGMPAFAALKDEELAELVTFLRHQFGGGLGGVDAELVRSQRSPAP